MTGQAVWRELAAASVHRRISQTRVTKVKEFGPGWREESFRFMHMPLVRITVGANPFYEASHDLLLPREEHYPLQFKIHFFLRIQPLFEEH